MKKTFVSLSLQVVDVQLSDCIAGSSVVTTQPGTTMINEIDCSGLTDTGAGTVHFDKW